MCNRVYQMDDKLIIKHYHIGYSSIQIHAEEEIVRN